MRDGLPRGVLETIAILTGITLVVLDAAGVVNGLAGGSLLLGTGGASLGVRTIPPRRQEDER